MDIAGQAQTGTGKTAAYLVAMYRALSRRCRRREVSTRRVRSILAPTRELAVQIQRDAEMLGQTPAFKLGLAFGGVDYDKQRTSSKPASTC